MQSEEKIIPYHTTDLTGRRVLVLAPHPDDETIGCGGSLVLHSEAGDQIKVVFLTNGARGDTSGKIEKDVYVELRQKEAMEACAFLGVTDIDFWAYEDRSLAGSHGALRQMIDLLENFQPELVYAPSPLEFHPDHRATAILLQDAIQSSMLDFDVAFYEVGQPLRVNLLVDISNVLGKKLKAINIYKTQIAERPYGDIVIALNRFRSLTLPDGATHAEGFSLWRVSAIKKIDIASIMYHGIERLAPDPQESGPLVSIIVRTKNRPRLLAEALKSITQQTYRNIEIIVVNDGGEDVKGLVQTLAGNIPLTYVCHEESKGRPAAANIGLKAANGVYLNFLDDDDIFYPHHLEKLVPYLETLNHQAVYSDCESGHYVWDGHKHILEKKELFLSVDFDANRLFFENYIPCMNILFKKSHYEKIGPIDENFAIYEDWDYWIRLSRIIPLHHIKIVTAQYRIYDGGSVGTTGRDFDVWYWTNKVYEKHQAFWSSNILIEYLRHTIGNRIGDLHREIGKIQLNLHEKENIIESQAKLIEQKEQVIEQKERVIEQKEQVKEQKERIIEENTKLYNEMSSQLNAIKDHLEQKEKLLSTIQKTISWRITKPLRIIRSFHIKFQFQIVRIKNYVKRKICLFKNDKTEDVYQQWLIKNEPSSDDLKNMASEANKLKFQPLFSVILPVYNIPPKWLKKAIESVREQIYTNWELCIVDDASPNSQGRYLLEYYEKLDPRIKVVFLKKNQHISGASNEALKLATGEFVALLDHDDEFAPHALFEVAKLLNEYPKADMIYSDEDHINPQGKRVNPHFKPDWSPDLFLSQMYTCHLGCYRRELINEIGGFRMGYEGSQDYDLVLRVMTHTNKIYHIPKILYHWRMVPTSVAGNPSAKDYADEAALKAINDYLTSNNINAVAEKGLFKFSYKVNYAILNQPLVSIIIPIRDQVGYLKRLINSIQHKTRYQSYQILIVNNQSEQETTLQYFEELVNESRIKVLDYPFPFNYSAINNFAAQQADGNIILFLNNDMEVVNKDWLGQMVQHAQRPEIGVVGARLHYPNNDGIQHAGVIIGIGGYAGHAHKRIPSDNPGYFGRVQLVQNFSAVTGACLMTRKDVFLDVGGFNENELKIAANDVDYCLRVREKGLRIVYTPYSELIHHESISRGYEDTPEKMERFNKEKSYFAGKWANILNLGDPYYNPNFTLDREDFSLKD